MARASWTVVGGAALATTAVAVTLAATHDTKPSALDQNVDAATLHRYHHTDQGTRIMPAAFLAALRMPDGERLMSPEHMRRWGFLVDSVTVDRRNPFGWPLGFTVSDPKVSQGVAVAGVTCALCHTGQLDYKGRSIRIEGGQADVDLASFQGAVMRAMKATAADPARRAAFLKDAVAAGYPAARVERDFDRAVATVDVLIYDQKSLGGTPSGPGRVDAVQGIANAVFATDLKTPSNAKDYDAPVNYPYLWDIWRLSWVQYNGFLSPNADSRNIGEVLGTSGKTNFLDPATGQLNPEPQRWRTSIQIDNLVWMEGVLKQLRAPQWPSEVLGPIDPSKARDGRALFVQHCSGCHGIKALPNGEWDVKVVSLAVVGTDPNQATNWAARTYNASKLGLGTKAPSTALAVAINAIRRQLYADNAVPTSKREPDVSFLAPCGYKARPLIGVWATPPFLHNGSVRTVYDLLSDSRPSSFRFGGREYDPARLGYQEADGVNTSVIDTSLPGNHNSGHWFTTDKARPGRIGPALTEAEKYAIIEYLKAATYDNYPRTTIPAMQPVACGEQPDWARQTAMR